MYSKCTASMLRKQLPNYGVNYQVCTQRATSNILQEEDSLTYQARRIYS
jgi:hypothetical protein